MSLYVCVCVSVSIFSSKTNSCFFMHGLWAGRCVCVCVCVGVCGCGCVCMLVIIIRNLSYHLGGKKTFQFPVGVY